jgi:hypothetical protein
MGRKGRVKFRYRYRVSIGYVYLDTWDRMSLRWVWDSHNGTFRLEVRLLHHCMLPVSTRHECLSLVEGGVEGTKLLC